jgi:predicted sulfurtransferase
MMRLFLLISGVAVLGVAVLSACNSAEFKNLKLAQNQNNNAQPQVPADGARRVTIAELKGMLDRHEAVVIDVRNEASFNSGHIRGAKLIPEGDLSKHLDELPHDKTIVTYCS